MTMAPHPDQWKITLHCEDKELQKLFDSMCFYCNKLEWSQDNEVVYDVFQSFRVFHSDSPRLLVELVGSKGEGTTPPKSVLQVLEEALKMMKERKQDGHHG